MSESDEVLRLKSNLLAHTRYLHKATTKTEWLDGPHQQVICDALERVVLGECTRLIINICPRAGKTDLAVKHFIAWALGLHPNSQFIHTTYSARLSAANAYNVRTLMQSEAYQDLWPEVRLKHDSQAKDEFKTTDGGTVYATGAGGTITGYGAGLMDDEVFGGAIIIDDPHKAHEADSDVMRQNIIDWFQNTIESRKNNPNTPIIVIMQRLHEMDLAGWLLAGHNGEEWEHINIPAITPSGESFWEGKFPIAKLENDKRKKPYVFSGQYMQNPTPESGGDFKPSIIEIVDAVPAGMRYVRGWDLAGTVKKKSDYTASVKMAIKNGIIYIADVRRGKMRPNDVETEIKDCANMDENTEQSIPIDPGQAGIAQQSRFSKMLMGKLVHFSRESGDKRSRAGGFAAQVNAGNVKILKAPWNKEYKSELRYFPLGENDDQVDASSRAFNRLLEEESINYDNI